MAHVHWHLHSPAYYKEYSIIKVFTLGEKYVRVPEALVNPVQQYILFPY
jgi:hypothetical protein